MLATIMSYGITGVTGFPVTVEVDITGGLPGFETVGLPGTGVRESRERVRSAIKNTGFDYPTQRITVNLAPADMRKEGPIYDLPIALGLLIASGQLKPRDLSDTVIIGELSLDGVLRPVRGVLPMLIDARSKGFKCVALPEGNVTEAQFVPGLDVYSLKGLTDAVAFVGGECEFSPEPAAAFEPYGGERADALDFEHIRGQEHAKRAASIAAAGGHNLLLVGPPGAGKTMLAKSLVSIMPELTFEESLEISAIYSAAGMLKDEGIVKRRPFRSPHRSASAVALTGGGRNAHPGEISLAHLGVLFLDEFVEYPRQVLETLRQPLEDGEVLVSRASGSETYPARFMLIAAMNPCPCGYLGSRAKECVCTQQEVARYRKRVSGPMYDRIDLHVNMSALTYDEISSKRKASPSKDYRERVQRARDIQRERYSGCGIYFNAQMDTPMLEEYCSLTEEGGAMLRAAFERLHLSARAYSRILKVARTIADMDEADNITDAHVAEAIQYRSMDRQLSETAMR